MRSVATFQASGFSTSKLAPSLVGSAVFGDDVARWLIARLRAAGAATDSQPEQEDFGWYFNFVVAGGPHTCVIGLRPGNVDHQPAWIIWVERRRGLLVSLIGGRSRNVAPSALTLLDGVLSTAPQVTHLRWHQRRAFDTGRENESASEP